MSTISASTTSTTAYKVTADTTGTLVLQTGSTPTTAATFDANQNTGLGVTPSSFVLSGFRSLEIGAAGSGIFSGPLDQNLLTNAYYNSGWKYAGTGVAVRYQMNSGEHRWYTAASGTAGNAISFTQAMTLDASGKLWVNNVGAWPSAASASGTNAGGLGSDGSVTSTTNGASAGYWNRNNTSGDLHRFYLTGTQVGSISVSGSLTSYNVSSDYRLKENIAPMTGALEKVAALKPCTYTWKADGADGEGFIAHELAEIVPQCVTGAKDAVDENGNPVYQGIDTSFLVATLVAAIKEQQAIINAQQAALETLTNRITALEAK